MTSPFFTIKAPTVTATPVLVEVPHAGLAIPESVRDEIVVPRDAIMRDADIYVDKLYADSPSRGATLLTTPVSRYVLDLNRAMDDIDRDTVPDHPAPRPVQPRGIVWRTTTDGRPAVKAPMSYETLKKRIDTFHVPYHAALRAELDRIQAQFGYVILLAAHSMPSSGRPGHLDSGARRADVVPGTRGRTTADARIIDLVDAHFRDAGLSVRHDDPYRGGFTTDHYGKPKEKRHAIQIELNRALYVDEETGRPKEADFARLEKLVLEVVTKLGALAL